MKVETRVMDKTSTLTGESVAMRLDPNATAHLMSVLTDLYSDTELAVLREYSTNALDAHTEAGVTRPIEVTLPSPLAPFLRVKDYGTGLSAADIRDVFSSYGTSTKRGTNAAVGMLGLGCKSALTYADSFTVVSTKDGRTIQVSVSRDEDGGGSMTVVSDEPSADADGTEVVVPSKRGDTFARKASAFFRYWADGTVLVNGEPPTRVGGLWLSDSLLLTDEADADTVVMGNVSYPFLDDMDDAHNRPSYRRGYSGGLYLVAFVSIGDVAFVPSREALQSTRRTKEKLVQLRADAERLRDDSIRAQVKDATSASEAVRILREGRRAGFDGDATFQGRIVPLELDRTKKDANGNRTSAHPDDADVSASFLRAGWRYACCAKVKGERTFTLDLTAEGFDTFLLFEGFDGREMTPTKRDKLEVWRESKGLDVAPQVFVTKLTTEERFWLDGRAVYDWADVDAIKLTRAATKTADGSRPRGSYHGFDKGTRSSAILAEEIDTAAPIYWARGGMYSNANGRELLSDAGRAVIVVLPENRVDKFLRDFPSAVEVDEGVRRQAASWLKSIRRDVLAAYVFQHGGHGAERLSGLDADAYDDPKLSLAIRESKRDTRHVLEGFTKFRGYLDTPAAPEYADALTAYPLLVDGYGTLRHNERDVILYTNAAYAARKDG